MHHIEIVHPYPTDHL